MSKEEITALAVRLFAILLIFYVLRHLPTVFIYFTEQDSPIIWSLVFLHALLLMTAVLMWKFPFYAAKWIAPYSVETQQTSWNSQTLVAVGCVLIGIFYLYYAISDLLYWAMIWQFNQDVEGLVVELTADQRANIVVTAIETILSLFLIIGARGISKTIHYFRYVGTDSSNK